MVLSLFQSGVASVFLANGSTTAFVDMPLQQRIDVFRSWSQSMFELKRILHTTFKVLAVKPFFSTLQTPPNSEPVCKGSDDTRRNLNWDTIGYPGPDPLMHSDKFDNEATLGRLFDWASVSVDLSTFASGEGKQYDAIIAGSGCGGGAVAAHLTKCGYRVLVVEKGKCVCPSKLTLQEDESIRNLYEKSGIVVSKTKSIFVLAGSCFGGGSTVNWRCVA